VRPLASWERGREIRWFISEASHLLNHKSIVHMLATPDLKIKGILTVPLPKESLWICTYQDASFIQPKQL